MNEPTTDAPAYTLARSSAGHESIWTNGLELNDAAVLAHLNGQAGALIQSLREQLDAARGDVIQRDIWLCDASAVEQDCRAQLDQARGQLDRLEQAQRHIRALIDLVGFDQYYIGTEAYDVVHAARTFLFS